MLAHQSQARETRQPAPAARTLYDRLGGRPCLERVHRRLYDKIFNHPVLGAFFAGKNRKHQEDQQSDFMADQFGGPRLYGGRMPRDAHQHMFITDEHFELRFKILEESLNQCAVPPDLRDRWLAIDREFKSHIVKKSVDDCVKRYKTDTILTAP